MKYVLSIYTYYKYALGLLTLSHPHPPFPTPPKSNHILKPFHVCADHLFDCKVRKEIFSSRRTGEVTLMLAPRFNVFIVIIN